MVGPGEIVSSCFSCGSSRKDPWELYWQTFLPSFPTWWSFLSFWDFPSYWWVDHRHFFSSFCQHPDRLSCHQVHQHFFSQKEVAMQLTRDVYCLIHGTMDIHLVPFVMIVSKLIASDVKRMTVTSEHTILEASNGKMQSARRVLFGLCAL